MLPTRNAQLAAGASIAETAAFALGGWLYQAAGAVVALIVDAVSYLVSALFLRGVAETQRPKRDAGNAISGGSALSAFAADVRAGLAALAALRHLRSRPVVVVAAALLLGWCWLRGLRLRFTWRQHLGLAVQGVPLFSLNYIVFYVATNYLTSGLVAVTFSTITIMINVGTLTLLGTPIRPRVAIAAVLGIAGLSLVFWPELAAFDTGSAGLIGLGLSLLATYSASLGNMVSVRHKARAIPVIESNAIGMAYGAGFALLFALARGAPLAFDMSWGYAVSLVYLALFGSVIGFGAYLTLLQKIGADRAAYSSVLFPLVALGLSTWLEGYRWTPLAAVGVALVLAGVTLVSVKKSS